MSKLRWYQEEAVASIFNYFAQGGKGNPVIAMPTGTGKSHIIGGFVQQTLQHWPRQRFMMLTHVKELIQQNANKLLEAWPEAPLGIYSAGLKQKDTMMPITFGGVASVYQNEELFGHIDVLIIDEAHLLSPKSGSMYQAVIAKLKAVNPYLIVVGLTATAFRLGQGLITDEGLFTDIVCDFTKLDKFNQLVQEGWISLLIPRQTATTIDVDGVGIQNGEFAQGALQDAVDKKEITYEACKEMCRNGGNRKSWLVFCSGVEHSEHVAEVLTGLGVHSAPVHSKLKDGERDDYIRRFKAGELRCLTNNNVLTTGFDHPPIDLIGMIRPTLSPGLWVQMLGRGSRPSRETDKHNCLVLDFAGNTVRLGPINDPVIPKKKGKGTGEVPVKICDHCGTYNHISVRFCVSCGAEFQFEVKITPEAAEAELIRSTFPIVESYNVTSVIYRKHMKAGRPPSLRVSYICGMQMFNEWIMLEDDPTTFPAKKARNWWRQRAMPPVNEWDTSGLTVDYALQYTQYLAQPKRIRVHVNKKWPEVVAHEF